MKNVLFAFCAVWIFLSSCSHNEEFSRDEAYAIMLDEMQFPLVMDYDIFCGDPAFAKKVLDAGLEDQGLLTVQRTRKLGDAGKPIIQFTAKAQPYLLPTPEADRISKIQRVKLAEMNLQEVTGIKLIGQGKRAMVEYTINYKDVTPFSALVKTNFNEASTNTAYFALYDDGWRLEK